MYFKNWILKKDEADDNSAKIVVFGQVDDKMYT